MMKTLILLKSLLCSAFLIILMTAQAQAETITIALSQEQDGGDAGRACMYIHNDHAEYRIVKPGDICPSTVSIERTL